MPAYETAHAAGMDLRLAEAEGVTLAPMERRAVKTGIAVAVPNGFEAQVRPRSGLSLKKGIGIVNSPGTIDADYRGEILVPLINFSTVPVTLGFGERIAQMVISPVARVTWNPVDALGQTDRGAGGFGHTGRE